MARPPSALTKFIRSLPADLPVKEVIEKAKAAGHETSESNVSRVRGMMAGSKAVKKTASKPKATGKSVPKKAGTKPSPETASTSSPAPLSKSDFIRKHPDLSVAEVIAKGKAEGLMFTRALVYNVRQGASKKATRTNTATSKQTATVSPSKRPASKTGTVNKAEFVRARSALTPRAVVEQAKAEGIKLDVNYVYAVRREAAARKGRKVDPKKSAASKPVVSTKTGTPTEVATPEAVASPSKPAPSNGTRPSGSATSVEDLLRAVAAELGLGRAMDILEGERARVRAVMGAG
jgi:hypothetical protein